MNVLRYFVRFPVRYRIQLIKLSLIQKPTHVRPMAEVIDLVSSDDEVAEASAVIAGFCETRGTRVRLSNSSQVPSAISNVLGIMRLGDPSTLCITRHFNLKDSSPIASLTTTVAAGAEGRFVVSDCDGHKRIESTHVENHFEQVCLHLGNEA